MNEQNKGTETNSEDENSAQIQTVNKTSENTFCEKQVTVDGKRINFIIDSGSPQHRTI